MIPSGSRLRWLLASLLIGLLMAAAHATPMRNSANGHYYEAITVDRGISWDAARTAASARTYLDRPGHLATVTSYAENRFIALNFPTATHYGFWLGGFQERGVLDPAAGWQWVTGEPFGYTNWNGEGDLEPNDFYGPGTTGQDENRLHFWYAAGGRWNDVRNRDAGTPAYGYLIEYETDPSPEPPTITGTAAAQAPAQAINSATPGTLLVITGANLGRTGTVLFSGIPLPAAVASWSATEVLLWVPPAPSYPFATRVTVVAHGKQAQGGDFTILAPSPNQVNLLANGSFEFPSSLAAPASLGYYTYGPQTLAETRSFHGYAIPGWRISSGTLDVKRTYWEHAPGEGDQSIDLVGSPGEATIHQTFFTEPGRRYVFSGWVAHNPGIPSAVASVFLNGASIGQIFHQGSTTVDNMRWVPFSIEFRAPASQATLTLRDYSGHNNVQGTALDGLKLFALPN